MKGIFKCKNCGKQFEKFWYTKIPIYCSVKCRDIFQIGKNSPHYGKHHTEEIKQKIREKRKLQTFSEETRKKLSEAGKGRKNPPMTKKHYAALYKSHTGKNSYFYGRHLTTEHKKKMSETRKRKFKAEREKNGTILTIFRPREVKEWAKQIKIRDNFTCQICHEVGGKLNSHHIKSWKDYPDKRYDVDNGITLCTDCHNWVHTINIG